jgi:hypothetical protein
LPEQQAAGSLIAIVTEAFGSPESVADLKT